MNIPGLSEATLAKFVDKGWLTTFGDLYELDRYKEQIVQENGFGIRSFERLQKAIASSRKTTLNRFIAAMGIHEVGALLVEQSAIISEEAGLRLKKRFRTDLTLRF